MKWTPPPDMDEECIALVSIMQELNIRTIGSCSGHGKKPIQVWMAAENLVSRKMAILTRAVGYGYTENPEFAKLPREWRLYIYQFDSYYSSPVCLMLEGPARPAAGDELAARIREAWDDQEFEGVIQTWFTFTKPLIDTDCDPAPASASDTNRSKPKGCRLTAPLELACYLAGRHPGRA